jgi:hypothetical protein
MSQVVATRSIQTTLPSSGSTHDRAQKLLKVPTFASKVFQQKRNKCSKLVFRSFHVSAIKSTAVEVVPVSPEDDIKVCDFGFFCCERLKILGFGDGPYG